MKRSFTMVPVACALALAMVVTACGGDDSNSDFDGIGDCTPVYAAVSSEKVGLMDRLSQLFRQSPEGEALSKCAAVVPSNVSSGEAAGLLADGWPKDATDKPQPVIWSPASTSWVRQVAGRLGVESIGESVSIARSPLVIAMPEQMARQLGWPGTPIDVRTLHDLCLNPQGWGKFGPAQSTWGQFKLGKTNPETSTSGQNMLLMQNYAAANKKADLTVADIDAGSQFSRELESCVIHYGDTTGNVLQRVYQRDQEGKPLDYVSAIAVEETSVINYNQGNPTSGVLKDGAAQAKPNKRLVAVYPSGGSLESDNPLVVLNARAASWASDEQRSAAQAFLKFAQSPTAQGVLGDFGFRPADPTAKPSGKVTAEYGADPAQPTTTLPPPSPEVVDAAKQAWNGYRKPSSVMELLDVSGSMGYPVSEGGPTRMDAAIASANATLAHFRPTDVVGVEAFTTDGSGTPMVTTIRPVTPLGGDVENLRGQIGALQPLGGTPMYDAVAQAYDEMVASAQPGRINAIVLLSDGKDEHSQKFTLNSLLAKLRGGPQQNSEVTQANPVRIFPIIYGQEAGNERTVLQQIAEATGGQVFDASDPRRINLVFSQVINNF